MPPKRQFRLPASAFLPLPQSPRRSFPKSIIDSHISFRPTSSTASSSELQSTLERYVEVSQSGEKLQVEGFVYVQFGEGEEELGEERGWEDKLEELQRYVGTPKGRCDASTRI